MSIGKIMSKALYCAKYLSKPKAVQAGLNIAKKTAEPLNKGFTKTCSEFVPVAERNGLGSKTAELGKKITDVFKKAPQEPGIIAKVESNTPGRILRMQDAKHAFTPKPLPAPFATTVSKESVPTLQKINEITGVSKGAVKDKTGWFNKRAAADALAAFKNEPAKPVTITHHKLEVQSVPTQKAIDDMLGISKVDALKTYEQGGRATREILEKRAAAREAFSGDKKLTSRIGLDYILKLEKKSKELDSLTKTLKCVPAEPSVAKKVLQKFST